VRRVVVRLLREALSRNARWAFHTVGISVAIHKMRVKLAFDLGELVRKTDTVYTKCKLLINRIYAMQPKRGYKRAWRGTELVA